MLDVSVGTTIVKVAAALTALEIPFHVTGEIVSSYHGIPRFTMDIDFVVVLVSGHRQIPSIVSSLENSFEIDIESAKNSLRSHGMFQALDKETLHKVDFHAGERVPDELTRSMITELFPGVSVPIACAEDSVISKLLWAGMGSSKSWTDAVGIVQRRDLRFDLLEKLARVLDLGTDLKRLLNEAKQ
ncbi:MAG: nucleotidyl transferase AbiEii/AbiGii toxin family protein [Candidatus Hydrogenedentes bacterium]|nr:nucleotidyl transferase AbiEii/AbiGii toxin family protein [Candidatus Hydrogenedentota bacterium]